MKELISSLLNALKLEEKLSGEKRVTPELEQQLKLWGAGIFRLVVMGEIKKGKSSFINALLGVENLVPVSSNVATSTIFKIRYGKERGYRVHFTAESNKNVLDINETELTHYGTEDGNPANREQVDFIEVMCSSPLLKTGIVIIDTPGLGGLFKEHKKITYQYVPRADAVFFVTDSVESPIGELELEYLRDIRSITSHLYFVQTKTCAVDSLARDARKKNNLAILSSALEIPAEKIPYFTVDSCLYFEAQQYKDEEDLVACGYPILKSFIQNVLQANQHKMLAARAISRMAPILTNLRDMVNSRRELLQADTEEKRAKRETDIARAQKELAEWEETKKPEILKRLQDDLKSVRRDAEDLCYTLRPGGEIQTEFENMIYNCEQKEALTQLMTEINQNLPVCAARVNQKIMNMVQDRVESILSEISAGCSTELSTDMMKSDRVDVNTFTIERVCDNMQNFNEFDFIRTGMYGCMAGAGLAAVVGGVIGSVMPGIGSIIGSWAGITIASFWGGSNALEIKGQQELRAAKNECRGAVSLSISSTYSMMQRNLNRVWDDISSLTSNAISNFVRERNSALNKRMEEIRERSKMDGEALRQRTKELQDAEMIVASIDKVIEKHLA